MSLWTKLKSKVKKLIGKDSSSSSGFSKAGYSGTTIGKGGGMSVDSSKANPFSKKSSSGSSSRSGSRKGGSSSGGQSRINPITQQAEYVLPSGQSVPVNDQTTKAITSGKSDAKVIVASALSNRSRLSQGGANYSSQVSQQKQPQQSQKVVSAWKGGATSQERIEGYDKGWGARESREATQLEKSRAGVGYNPYTYQGTAYETPTMTIGDVKRHRKELAELKKKEVEYKEEQKVRVSAETEAEKAVKEYQKTGDYDTYERKINKIPKKMQEDYQKALESSEEYGKAKKKYVQVLKEEDFVVDELSGKPMLSEKWAEKPTKFEKITGTTPEQAMDTAVLGASIGVGAVNPVLGGAIATGYYGLKTAEYVKQKPPKEIALKDIFQNVEFKDDGVSIKDTALSRKYKEIRSKEKSYAIATLASAVSMGYANFKSASAIKSPNEQKALDILNKKLRKGTLDITEQNLKTGTFTIDIVDDVSGKTIKQAIKVENIDDIYKAQGKIQSQKALQRLGLDKKVKIESVGAIEKQNLLGLSDDLSDDLMTSIKKGEIGKATRINIKTGKPETRYVVALSEQTGEKGKQVFTSFKIGKDGKIYSVRTAVTDIKSGQTFLGRQPYPSELKRIKVKTDIGDIILEETQKDRIKFEKVLKTKSSSSITDDILNEKTLRKIKSEGISYKTGGKLKGTHSLFDLSQEKIPAVYKQTKPFPVEKFKGAELQILREDGSGMLGRKVLSENIDNLIEFDVIKESTQKTPLLKSFNKVIEQSADDYARLINSKKNLNLQIVDDVETAFTQLTGTKAGFNKQTTSSLPKIITKQSTSAQITIPAVKYTQKQKQVFDAVPSPIGDIKLKDLQKNLLKTKQKQKLKLKTGHKVGMSSAVVPILKDLIKQEQPQKQKLKQLQKLKLRQQPIAPNIPAIANVSIQGMENPLEFNIPKPFPIPKRNDPFKQSQKQLRALYKLPRSPKPKYTASLNASAFNISQKATKKQIKELQSMEFTGFETRPLIDISGLNKKKSKKSKKRKNTSILEI